MRVLLCPDKFKGTFSARQVAKRLRRAVRKLAPDWEVDLCPLADGGEGFAEVMQQAWHGRVEPVRASGPLGQPLWAPLVWRDAETACFAMSSVAGLELVPPEQRDAWRADTRGVGEMIAHAVKQGAATIYVGLGGSATTDGGQGMAAALGLIAKRPKWVGQVRIIAACDVTNPLLGKNGCVRIFGPQKSVLPQDFPRFERRLKSWVAAVEARFPKSKGLHLLPGSGAAGGLGFALQALLAAERQPGFQLVAQTVNLTARMEQADVVITGEGKLDASSFQGKVVGEVLKMAEQAGKPCYVLCGVKGDFPAHLASGRIAGLQATTDFARPTAKKRLKAASKALVQIGYSS